MPLWQEYERRRADQGSVVAAAFEHSAFCPLLSEFRVHV